LTGVESIGSVLTRGEGEGEAGIGVASAAFLCFFALLDSNELLLLLDFKIVQTLDLQTLGDVRNQERHSASRGSVAEAS